MVTRVQDEALIAQADEMESLDEIKLFARRSNQIKQSVVATTFSIGEMFCGPGGLGIASILSEVASPAGNPVAFTHKFALDYDADSCATYKTNIGAIDKDCLVLKEDVRTFDLQSLPYVDGFLFGFPCNDFSTVGESRGLEGNYGPLYQYGVHYVSMRQPLFFVAENVSGLSSANKGLAFNMILDALANAGAEGYELTTHLYKFEEYGVPQARHRYIIIGIRNDLRKRFNVPVPTYETKTTRQALEEPPIPAWAAHQELTRQSPTVIERLKKIRPGENAWTADLPQNLKLNVKGAKLSMIYRRLDPERPSYTVTGSGGGGTHIYHYDEPRALTNRERARLQTFPDWFNFIGSKESVRKQIGMAVPVNGAKIILEAILKTLIGVDYESLSPSEERSGKKRFGKILAK